MDSIDTYEKLRGKLNQIFKEGENLVEGDEFWLGLISDSMEPKEVFEIVKEMKEKGNTFFKSKEIENALEMYGYGITILARYKFQEESDRTEFCDLALCMLLNSTACFSKLKDFVQVGQLCSIILEFQPENVKALYRRGVAAVELGRHDMAYWDLVSAAAINPSSQEVCKKLEEVKSFIKEKKSRNQHDGPKGLGTCLPSLAKKSQYNSEMQHSSKDQQKLQGKESESNSVIDDKDKGQLVVVHEDAGESLDLPYMKKDGNNGKSQEKEVDDKLSTSNEDDKNSSVCSMEEEPVSLTEPTYQFRNRRKPGAMLSFSRHSYRIMSQGKSLQFYNAKSGSFMEVRLVSRKPESKNGSDKLNLSKDLQEHEESMETQSDVQSCVTDDGNNDVQGAECSSHDQQLFQFSAMPKFAGPRKRYEARRTIHAIRSSSLTRNKIRKSTANNSLSPSPTNKIYGCRFTQAMKRKCDHPPSLGSYHYPRKRKRAADYGCNPCAYVRCLGPCTNACKLSGASFKDQVYLAHAEVSD